MTLKELKDAVNYFDSAYDDMTIFVGDGYGSFIETPTDLKVNLVSEQLEMTIDTAPDDEITDADLAAAFSNDYQQQRGN